MKRILIALVAVVVTSIAVSPAAHAKRNADLRLGDFGREWCGYSAAFHIESKEPDRWVFHGTITFAHYDVVDELWIEQYEDNSLRMIRYLSGDQAGDRQVVQTHPPQFKKTVVSFSKQRSNGTDCEGANKNTELVLNNA